MTRSDGLSAKTALGLADKEACGRNIIMDLADKTTLYVCYLIQVNYVDSQG